jgi:hypothetical protein
MFAKRFILQLPSLSHVLTHSTPCQLLPFFHTSYLIFTDEAPESPAVITESAVIKESVYDEEPEDTTHQATLTRSALSEYSDAFDEYYSIVARNASIEIMIEENKNRQDVEHVCDESIKTAQAERRRRAEVESAYNLIRAESLATFRASVLIEKRRRRAEIADNLDSLRCIEIELEQSGVKAAAEPPRVVLPVLPSYRSSRSLKARRLKERFDLIDAAAERDFIAVLTARAREEGGGKSVIARPTTTSSASSNWGRTWHHCSTCSVCSTTFTRDLTAKEMAQHHAGAPCRNKVKRAQEEAKRVVEHRVAAAAAVKSCIANQSGEKELMAIKLEESKKQMAAENKRINKGIRVFLHQVVDSILQRTVSMEDFDVHKLVDWLPRVKLKLAECTAQSKEKRDEGCCVLQSGICNCNFCELEKALVLTGSELSADELSIMVTIKKHMFEEAFYMPSGGARNAVMDDDEEVIDVEKEDMKVADVEALRVLREAAWGENTDASVENRARYFELLSVWKWDFDEEDERHIRTHMDKDVNAMLAFITMITPHVDDSTCCLKLGEKDNINDYFKNAGRSCSCVKSKRIL